LLPVYFLLGQSRMGQLSQFSSSSFSSPKGIISPHRQAHPSAVFVSGRSSQIGQQSMGHPHIPHDTCRTGPRGMIKIRLSGERMNVWSLGPSESRSRSMTQVSRMRHGNFPASLHAPNEVSPRKRPGKQAILHDRHPRDKVRPACCGTGGNRDPADQDPGRIGQVEDERR